MPIFNTQLRPIDVNNPTDALKQLASHIKYIQEQLEYTLTNLDSSNVTEIETDVTNITSASGDLSITGRNIKLSGLEGQEFAAGVSDENKKLFAFSLKGKNGEQQIYMSDAGKLVITGNVVIGFNIDCGNW